MAKSINQTTLLGFLGNDPELRQTQSGLSVCNFRVATNEQWKNDAGDLVQHTEWHRITVWGKMAEVCTKYLQKGSRVYLAGRNRNRVRKDEKTGVTYYWTEVIANPDSLILFNGNQVRKPETKQEPESKVTEVSEDDVPQMTEEDETRIRELQEQVV